MAITNALKLARHGCYGGLPGSRSRLVRAHGKDAVMRYERACFETIDVIGAALAKEGIFEWVMSRLDRAPLWERLPRVAARVSRASRRVVWPSVSSLGSLRRQARVSVLA